MKNTMIKTTNLKDAVYTTCPTKNVEKLVAMINEFGTEVETFEVGNMPLNSLPEEIQEEVKSILKAYNEVTVSYGHGRFNVSVAIAVLSSYPYDHFVCGRYLQTDVYTAEERARNFKEEFGYLPCYL